MQQLYARTLSQVAHETESVGEKLANCLLALWEETGQGSMCAPQNWTLAADLQSQSRPVTGIATASQIQC